MLAGCSGACLRTLLMPWTRFRNAVIWLPLARSTRARKTTYGNSVGGSASIVTLESSARYQEALYLKYAT